MSRKCFVTSKGVLSGNNVSHSNRKTRTRFLPNMHKISFMSDALQRIVSLRMSVNGLRTVERGVGIDAFLLGTPNATLSNAAKIIKRKIERAEKVKVIKNTL